MKLPLPAGDYVLIVKSNVVAGTEYGYVEQAFHSALDTHRNSIFAHRSPPHGASPCSTKPRRA